MSAAEPYTALVMRLSGLHARVDRTAPAMGAHVRMSAALLAVMLADHRMTRGWCARTVPRTWQRGRHACWQAAHNARALDLPQRCDPASS